MVASIAALGVAATAGASPWEKFKNCPVNNPGVGACLYGNTISNTTKWASPDGSSEFTAGSARVPLTRPVVVQGGEAKGSIFAAANLFDPEDGAPTVMSGLERVPGGLKAVIDPSRLSGAALAAYVTASRNFETNRVFAVIETAPSLTPTVFVAPEHILTGSGTAISLPLKVKFINPFLGESCYAGSDAEPIAVELTAGTTSPPPPAEPMTGQAGHIAGFYKKKFGGIAEASLVSNTFAAPGVQGCGAEAGWQEEVDSAINSKVGLPSPAGMNSTRINGSFLLVGSGAVKRELGL
jgi:hypothetical protein